MGDGLSIVFSPYEVRDRYLAWLTTYVTDGLSGRYSFNKLLWALYDIDFYAIVSNDDNRATDGERLREEFAVGSSGEMLDTSTIFEKPCSVLEMLIALSIRIDDEIMWNPDKGDRSAHWFWEMIGNLGLNDLSDDRFEANDGYLRVRMSVGEMLGRTYSTDGIGGLFPLPGFEGNMREMEIWYQMNAYMLQNYGVEDEVEEV